MEIPKGIRRVFSSDFHQYQAQLKKLEKTVPAGAPELRKAGKTPVGPNRVDAMTPKERKSHSPDYPVQYQFPVESKEKGFIRKRTTFVPTGERASFTSGPGLLPPEHRVPGRFDYGIIPDITVRPVDAEGWASPAMGLSRPAKQGLPADPETGVPKLPPLKQGSYKIEEQFPVIRQEPPTRARQRPSLDSFGFPRDSD
jgi:hypothetical protein